MTCSWTRLAIPRLFCGQGTLRASADKTQWWSEPARIEPSSDGALIARSLAEPEVFSLIFDRHFVAVHGYLARRAGREHADDLSHVRLMRGIDYLDRLTSGGSRLVEQALAGAKQDGAEGACQARVQNELMLANPAGLLYGAIMIGTLLAAESAKRETYPRTVGAVLIAMVLLWLVRGYTLFTAHRLRESAPLELSGLARTMAAELAIVLGAAPPLIAVMISWAVGASLNSAVVAGVWTSAGVIIIIELISGVRAGQTGRDLVFQTAFGALLGLLVIALRLLLH